MYAIDSAAPYTPVSISNTASSPSVNVDLSTTGSGAINIQFNSWIGTSFAYGNGRWVHVAATIDYTTYKLSSYLNGVLSGTASASGISSVSQSQWMIGKSGGGTRTFHGYIRQFVYFDRILTAADIASVFAETDASTCDSGKFTDPVQAYISFNMVDGKDWVKVFEVNQNTTTSGSVVSDLIGKGLPFKGLNVQTPSMTNHFAYYSSFINYNAGAYSSGTTGGNMAGYKAILGSAGGHGWYNSLVYGVCYWGESTGGVGSGYYGASGCGSYATGLRMGYGWGDPLSFQYTLQSGTWTYWIWMEALGSPPVFSAYCDMETDGGGWTMCYTSSSAVQMASEISSSMAFGNKGYRSDCRNIPFSEILYISHNTLEKAWFASESGISFTASSLGYWAASGLDGRSPGSLFLARGAANTAYFYQLLICADSGFFMSGYYNNLYKTCSNWQGDYASAYFKTGNSGIPFNENGFGTLPLNLVSVGVRMGEFLS